MLNPSQVAQTDGSATAADASQSTTGSASSRVQDIPSADAAAIVERLPTAAKADVAASAIDALPDAATVTVVADALATLSDGAKTGVVTDAVGALPDAAKTGVVTSAVQALPEGAKTRAVTSAMEALGDAAKASVVTSGLHGLPEQAKADVAAAAIQSLGAEAKADATKAAATALPTSAKDDLIEHLAPDQAVTNDIWRWIVKTFAIVLVGAMVALVAAVFVSFWHKVDTALVQVLLTIFTTTAGILAGFVSGRASTGRARAS